MKNVKGVTILKTIDFYKQLDAEHSEFVESQYEIFIEDCASFNEVYSNFIILEKGNQSNTYIVVER